MSRVEITFNTNGNDKQKEACKYWIDNETEQLYYGGAKGGAKSYTGCSLIFGDALIYPETHYFIAREQLNDLRKYTIPSIKEVFNHWGIKNHQWKYNGQDNYFELYNGSIVYLTACKDVPSDQLFETFGSMQITRGWIEEGSQVSKDAKDNLWLSVGRWKNEVYGLKKKMLVTFNPKKNWLYTEIYKPSKDGTLPKGIKFVRALVYDNKMISTDYVKSLEGLKGIARQRLLEGSFEYDNDDTALIEYDALLDAFTNTHVPSTRKMAMTADIAHMGSDRFVVTVWDGWIAIYRVIMKKVEPKDVAKIINDLKVKFHVPNSRIVYDADGLGSYVGLIVPGAKAFHNGAPALKIAGQKENYEHLKAQCSYRAADRINKHGMWLKCFEEEDKEVTIEELEQIKKRDPDSDGKLKIVKKEEVKANIGRSPDIADTIVMREFLDLVPSGGADVSWS